MIVEDSPEMQRLLLRVLTARGFNVSPVPTGSQALPAALQTPPDLILLDIGLPDMNGYEVCERLKANDRLRPIPVIFISGLEGELDKVKAFAAGGVDYLTKPFHLAELEARVCTHLTLRQQARQLQLELAERQRAEAALREKEQQSRDVFEHAPVGIFHSAPEGRFLSVNPVLARMLGYASPEELIAATSDMATQIYADPAVRPQIMAWIQETSGWVCRDAVAWRRKDGRVITVDMTGRKVCNAAGAIVYLEGFIVDVTERKQAEAALARVLAQRTEEWRQATSAALSASEEEARRIGQELHDTLCQDLIGIARQAEAAALAGVETDRVSDAMADRLRRLASLAAVAARQARGLSYLLAVSEPLDGQLDESLRGHVRQLESLYDFTCDLPPDGVLPPWSTEQGVHIIRIVRESLVNAARHAHARRIWLDCLPEQGQTILSISSDGAPAPAPETWKPGLGLRQMRMRAALLGATLTFRPGPQGVVVQLALPEKS